MGPAMHKVKDIICNFLPRRQRNKAPIPWLHVYANILVVDCGFKPAWLCDFAFYNSSKVDLLLNQLARLGVIHLDRILVLEVDSSFLIVNRKALMRIISGLCASTTRASPRFIVVEDLLEGARENLCAAKRDHHGSAYLEILRDKVVRNLSPLLKCLPDESCRYHKVSFRDANFTPTFFGIALGYPVVYLYRGDVDIDLGFLDVSLYTIVVGLSSLGIDLNGEPAREYVVVYSFSSCAGCKECANAVDDWHKDIVRTSESLDLNIEFSYEDKFSLNLVL